MGAPKNNTNALKTGARSKRLTLGELPKAMLSVKREGRAYRRELERVVLAAKGEISTVDSHHIDSASAATVHAGICRWILRHKIDEMRAADVLAASREIVKAKQARDASVRALELDQPEANPWVVDEPEEPNDD